MTEALLNAGSENTDAASTTAAPETAPAAPDAATQQPGTPPVETATSKPESSTPAAEGAPETYADFTTPEGTKLDTELASEVQGLAKTLGLTQDKAQQVMDLGMKLAAKGVQQQTETLATEQAKWTETSKAEFSPELLATASAAYKTTTTPQMQYLLTQTGLGNHPEFIRHFLKIAPAFAEDGHVTGGKAPPGEKSAAKVLYPNSA